MLKSSLVCSIALLLFLPQAMRLVSFLMVRASVGTQRTHAS
jgi:hypothetical protein